MRETPRPVTGWWIAGMSAAGLACVLQIVLPSGTVWPDLAYYATGGVACIVLFVAAIRMPKESSLVWWGFFGYVAFAYFGDVVYVFQERVLAEDPFPGPADLFYIGCYVWAAFGLIVLNHRLNAGRDSDAWIDAGIITIGAFAVFSVGVFAPILRSADVIDLAVVVSLIYPLLDLVIIAVLVRLLAGVKVRSLSLSIVVVAFATTMAADVLYQVMASIDDTVDLTGITEAMYLAALVLLAGAATVRDAERITTAADAPVLSRRTLRAAALGIGVLLTPIVLTFVLWRGGGVLERVLAVSTIVAILLAVVRIRNLMAIVRRQSLLLEEQARTDPLTGLPNRRTLDFEINRALAVAATTGQDLTVAMLDLDHFKDYNDEHGHLGGDALLRAAATSWTDALPQGAFLARYGGEEFAVVLLGHGADRARDDLERLRTATPECTVSIGYAQLRTGQTASEIIACADEALYTAKAGGRDLVVGYEPSWGASGAAVDLRLMGDDRSSGDGCHSFGL